MCGHLGNTRFSALPAPSPTCYLVWVAVLALVFILGWIVSCRELRGGVINVPPRFTLWLAFSARVYTTYRNCLRWLGDHARFGHQALGG